MLRQALITDLTEITKLALCLWPGHTFDDLANSLEKTIKNNDESIFIKQEGPEIVAFAQAGLRRDYVEGTDSSPVGYLEGIYVKENHRLKGIAKELTILCQNWSKAKGCQEFASDCELTNKESLDFHLKLGFEEANRVICFVKKL